MDVAASDGLARRAVLEGTLAPEVGNMTALRVLNLASNNLSVRLLEFKFQLEVEFGLLNLHFFMFIMAHRPSSRDGVR